MLETPLNMGPALILAFIKILRYPRRNICVLLELEKITSKSKKTLYWIVEQLFPVILSIFIFLLVEPNLAYWSFAKAPIEKLFLE